MIIIHDGSWFEDRRIMVAMMFATKFVLTYRLLGEHQDKTPASILFPPHSIKTVTRSAQV